MKIIDKLKFVKQVIRSATKLTDSPSFSPRSAATLSETDMADIRLGWVHIILQTAPRTASISDSKMYWGSCVVLPQPVSPETTMTCKIICIINCIIVCLVHACITANVSTQKPCNNLVVQKIAFLSIHTRQYRWTDQNRLLCVKAITKCML